MTKKAKMTNAVIVLLLIAGVAWIASIFVHVGGEYTDNAQVQQNFVEVNARVQGFVGKIYVDEFQKVRKGDTLLVIDDAEFRLHLAQAEAALAAARSGTRTASASVNTLANNVFVSDAQIAEAAASLANAKRNHERYEQLYAQNSCTQQERDNMLTAYETAKARHESLLRAKRTTALAVSEQSQRVEQTESSVKVAEAALNLARLNLGYCVVLAPCDGYTSRKMVQEGELVMPGRKLFTIVDDSDRWIIANYRETQCGAMAPGDKAEIRIDAFPDLTFEGEIERVSTATGASYSSMAPDNSTGNFVKVEQRIPVKIRFTKNNDKAQLNRLSAGMNAVVTVANR